MGRIYIHPFTYLLIFLSIITGMFKEFFMIFSIIIVHEIGHTLMAYLYKWKFVKIAIYPFGGTVKFDEDLNKPIIEELFILLAGPLMQIIFYIFVYFLMKEGIITYRNFNLFKTYNYALLIFNLIPIYPLDGGRLFNLFMNYLFPYKKGNKIAIIVSIIMIIFCLYMYKNISFIFMGLLLLTEVISYLKKQDYLYNKLLLERYITPHKYKKLKIISNKDSMYKEKRHIIFYKDKYITEKDYLNERFKVIK